MKKSVKFILLQDRRQDVTKTQFYANEQLGEMVGVVIV